MRKIVSILFIAASLGFMCSCGPSAKEIEAKHIADSTRVADSLGTIHQQFIADLITKSKADSVKLADSLAKIKHNKHNKVYKSKKVKK